MLIDLLESSEANGLCPMGTFGFNNEMNNHYNKFGFINFKSCVYDIFFNHNTPGTNGRLYAHAIAQVILNSTFGWFINHLYHL